MSTNLTSSFSGSRKAAKIALAQINPQLGNYSLNADKILSNIQRAHKMGAKLIVFSEMCLFGYPAYDLLENEEEYENQARALEKLLRSIPEGITAIFGAVTLNPKKLGKKYQNSAVVAAKNKKTVIISKQLLPSYDVFDDTRFFEPGEKTCSVSVPGIGKVAVTVCEDMWSTFQKYKLEPFKTIKGVKLLVNISASPYDPKKVEDRLKVAAYHAKKCRAPFVYVNQVGGQDELIFDGNSFVLNSKGEMLKQAHGFSEDFLICDLNSPPYKPNNPTMEEDLKNAIVLGLKDFVHKTGQQKVHLGLSGGIDSALVACLAVDALGAENVVGFLLPGPFSSMGSISDSLDLARNLNIETRQVSIQEYYSLALATMESLAKGSSASNAIAEQNVQARLRALVLMMYSNLTQSMLLATSNKSELACGYATLYGDTCGGLMPIGDLTKHQVYAVAKLYSAIPDAIFKKAPSAELAPNQKDQDSLPPYPILDKAVENVVEKTRPPASEVEKWLKNKLDVSEFKRWQAPPILRLSSHAFGRGRRVPIAHSRQKSFKA